MRAPLRLLTTPTPAMFSRAISTNASSAAVSGVTAITCACSRARSWPLSRHRTPALPQPLCMHSQCTFKHENKVLPALLL